LGRGGLTGQEAGSALIGLQVLESLSYSSICDASGYNQRDGSLAILSRILQAVSRSMGVESHYVHLPVGWWSYRLPTRGTIPVILDEQVAATIIAVMLAVK
jgi:hypothetical protein